jgi:ferritin-like metal-binding protein YciE
METAAAIADPVTAGQKLNPHNREDPMPDQTTRDEKLIELLNEAYGKECQLEVALGAHLEVVSRADYEKRLRQHLKETKSHATKVSRRIKQLGGTAETISLPGPEGASKAAQNVKGIVGKAKAAAQGPLHLARGSGEQAKMLHNARIEYREEAEEIATYTVIDALATSVGDTQTAKLARDIRAEEERMAKFIGELLPQLATDVAHDEIPVSEIEGPAKRRKSTPSGRTRKAPASSSRSPKSRSPKKSGAKR